MSDLRVSQSYMVIERERQSKANNEYHRQMMRCIKKIEKNERITALKEPFIIVKIPVRVPGISHYNSTDCLFYVINSLRDRKIVVEYSEPNLLKLTVKNEIKDRDKEIKKQFLSAEAKKTHRK